MKTTLKDIRSYVTTNAAEDLTKKRFAEIDAIRVAECGFETIAYSTGIYGRSGKGHHHRQTVCRHRSHLCAVSGYVIGGAKYDYS